MNLYDAQNIISIKEKFLDDEEQRTEFIITHCSWDANGVLMETVESISLTPLAQDEICRGLKQLIKKFTREEF
jgi:hypothetical protein